MIKSTHPTLLPLSLCLLAILSVSHANQATNLHNLIMSKRLKNNHPVSATLDQYSSVYIGPQDGLMEADKIDALPGQPDTVDFDQYSGYVTVDPKAGRALFYYFVESPHNSSSNPLLIWFNGGPGCSSFGNGAMLELGPFRVNSDGKTLFKNKYSWNNAANVIFLESPAGVGFSYSNTSSDYDHTGDNSTAIDAYTFIVNWLERFPQYKIRDLYLAGESYAGHYVPQLAYTIMLNNKKTNQTMVNLIGYAIGNPAINDVTDAMGFYDHQWTHALISDETHEGIISNCHFDGNSSTECRSFTQRAAFERGHIDIYNIYAPLCQDTGLKNGSVGTVNDFDPCSDYYVDAYLNTAEVQQALHTKPTSWSSCSGFNWMDSPDTVLPIIEYVIANGLRVWIYSGDIDAIVSVTATRYSINSLKLPIQTAWRPWYLNNEVGGYVVGYKGLTFATVRGAGHLVPSYQPERALTLISSFLQGTLPPSA